MYHGRMFCVFLHHELFRRLCLSAFFTRELGASQRSSACQVYLTRKIY